MYTTEDFSLASANAAPSGIAWNGAYIHVLDMDDKVYTDTYSGAYTYAQDFDLASASQYLEGITWDGTYLRVVDYVDDKVYSYEGLMPAFLSHGLQDDLEYGGLFAAAATAVAGDWTCIASSTAQTIQGQQRRAFGPRVLRQGSWQRDRGRTPPGHHDDNTSDLSLFATCDRHPGGSLRVGRSPYGWTTESTTTFASDTNDLAFTEEVGGLADSEPAGLRTPWPRRVT